MALKIQYTTPDGQPSFANAYLEWFRVDMDKRTISGFVALADAAGNRLKSIPFDATVPANTLANWGGTILTKLIAQAVIKAGSVVEEP